MDADRIAALERECTRLRGLLKGYAGGAIIDELARMDKALADEQGWRKAAEANVRSLEKHLADSDAALAPVAPGGLWIGGRIAVVESAAAVVSVARAYRAAETDGTPRMWRGKDLQDLATALDEALARLEAPTAMVDEPWDMMSREPL